MNKNDRFELLITDIGSDGEGIGHFEGMTFFVNGAVKGDKILAGVTKLKKNFGYARVIEVLEASPDRAKPVCPIAKRCGGCQLQSLSYAAQLEYKQNKVKNAIARIGGFDLNSFAFEDIMGMEEPLHYRNKGQFPVGYSNDGRIISGFYAERSHAITETASCALQHEITDIIMDRIRGFMEKYHIRAYDEKIASTGHLQDAGLVRHVLTRVGFVTHEVLVCIVINGRKFPKAGELTEVLREAVGEYNAQITDRREATGEHNAQTADRREATGEHSAQTADRREAAGEHSAPITDRREAAGGAYRLASLSINVNTDNTNVIMGNECSVLYGEGFITDYIGDVKYRISPLSFYQVNPVQTKKLYSTALDFAGLTGKETVWDLYCGIGTISLFLAQKAKQVYGVEIIPQAVEDATANAAMNNITNAEFFAGAAEEILPAKYEQDPAMRADVIVVDPPRKGCDPKLLECIVKLEPKRIVYVSCDPATLARDMKLLAESGYRPERVRPCDMFPQTVHVETVVLLSQLRQKPDDYIDVDVDVAELEGTSAETKATYEKIKKYVAEHNDGMKVSNLYIAQVKRKCGIELAENFNLPKSEDAKQPQCPKEKEDAIVEALKVFKMI